jgi:general secretion pathway protein H
MTVKQRRLMVRRTEDDGKAKILSCPRLILVFMGLSPRGGLNHLSGPAKGFTLIETIVVLVIAGLALTVVASFLPRRNATLELSSATARVSGALRLARSRAMAEDRPVPFAAVPDGHGFLLDNVAVTLGPLVTMTLTPPRAIVFEPDGSASGAVLRVSSSLRQREIRVDWLTGRVLVAGGL